VDSRDRRALSPSRGQVGQLHVYLPTDLITLLRVYQIGTNMVSLSEAVRRLMESHPDLQRLADRVYDVGKAQAHPDRPE
jgi:hypothetical protein